MTVADLIRRLQAAPQDAVVVVPEMRGVRGDTYEARVTAQRFEATSGKIDENHPDGQQWRTDWVECAQIDGPLRLVVVIE